jgi:bleomycin hydrolase
MAFEQTKVESDALCFIIALQFYCMKKDLLCFLLVVSAAFHSVAQSVDKSIYQFTTIKDNAVGQTEDQCATGTCWSFATISFLESEIIRKGNKPVDLSEMFNVRLNYTKKADSFVRFQGKQQFGPGGLSHDVINIVREFGLVPESAFSGLLPGKTEYDHGGLDAMLESTVKTVLDKKLNEQGNEWKQSLESILNAGIGVVPSQFEYNGKKYTPATFRDELKISASEYVNLTSFTHQPFYQSFVLEVPDNWSKGSFYNLPLDEFMRVMDNALDNGFTIAWDADVSERGFSFTRGLGILVDETVKKDEMWNGVMKELSVDPQKRQDAFDRFQTTDDHLMHITGKAKDQDGTVYYITKNSWGTENIYKGFQYCSRNYVMMKTVAIVVHKDALPKDIKAKLNIS